VQQNLVLILARELADKLASAMFVVDGEGRLAYFNERAADILGEPFSEVGRIAMEDWSTAFKPTSLEGEPLEPENTPLVSAVLNREPAHMTLRIEGRDGTPRHLAVTAFPLFAHEDEFVGAAAIFWELSGSDG
jgi:PAS domain-containing protein